MKCSKCETEVERTSKFCSNCGEKVEGKSDIDIEGLAKTCSQVWYIVGYVRAKNTKEELEDFEERIRKHDDSMFDWYQDVVSFWEKWVKENNEKNKKTNESKRTSISEDKATSKKQK
jgi:hypothetical protein